MVDWFDTVDINRSAARFDFAKLEDLNGHYIRHADDQELLLRIEDRAALPAGRRGDRRAARRQHAGEVPARHAGPQGARQDAGRARRTAPTSCSPTGRWRSTTRRRSCSTRRRASALPTCCRSSRRAGRWKAAELEEIVRSYRRGDRRQARQGRPAAARRPDRQVGVAAGVRRHGRARPRRSPGPHPRPGRLAQSRPERASHSAGEGMALHHLSVASREVGCSRGSGITADCGLYVALQN